MSTRQLATDIVQLEGEAAVTTDPAARDQLLAELDQKAKSLWRLFLVDLARLLIGFRPIHIPMLEEMWKARFLRE